VMVSAFAIEAAAETAAKAPIMALKISAGL
jgi:hypothetical protein